MTAVQREPVEQGLYFSRIFFTGYYETINCHSIRKEEKEMAILEKLGVKKTLEEQIELQHKMLDKELAVKRLREAARILDRYPRAKEEDIQKAAADLELVRSFLLGQISG